MVKGQWEQIKFELIFSLTISLREVGFESGQMDESSVSRRGEGSSSLRTAE